MDLGAGCVKFFGHHEHRIDAKNRLAIPAEIRNRWRSEEDGAAFFAIPWREGVIRLYPERDFFERAKAAQSAPTLTPNEDEAELQATLFGLSSRVEWDSVGRIRLAEEMMDLVGLGQDVVRVGCGDRLEVRDQAAWREARRARLAELPGQMARIEARRGEGSTSRRESLEGSRE